jgi:hypothetical protein
MGSIQALHLESSRNRHRDENHHAIGTPFRAASATRPSRLFVDCLAALPRLVPSTPEGAADPHTRRMLLTNLCNRLVVTSTRIIPQLPIAWLALSRPPLPPLTLSAAPTCGRPSQSFHGGAGQPEGIAGLEWWRSWSRAAQLCPSPSVRLPKEGRPPDCGGVNLRVAFSASRRPNDLGTDTPCRTASEQRLSSLPVHGTEDPFHRQRTNAAAFQIRSAFRR